MEENNYVSKRFVACLMILSIVVISYVAYSDILDYFFIGIDSISEVDTGRVQSFSDVTRIFLEPSMGTIPDALDIQKWYRPIAMLSYSIDYSIWGLNPFGYHLTDIVLHIAVSILVFFLTRRFTKDHLVIPWLGALIFTIHPIIIEGLPVSARRHDMIAALFLLLSLILFLKYYSSEIHSKGYLLFSLFSYALAVGGKEIAVILPFIIFTYVFISTEKETFKENIMHALKVSLPYLILTFIYIGWRIYVLRGMGGYGTEISSIIAKIQMYLEIGLNYFVSFLYPVDFLRLDSLFSPFLTPYKQAGFIITLLALLVLSIVKRDFISRLLNHDGKEMKRNLKILFGIVAVLSLISILMYPLLSPYINNLIQKAYDGTGPGFISSEMNNIGVFPVETYFYRLRDLFLRLCLVALILSVICFTGIHQLDNIKLYVRSARGKLVIFLLVWMVLPLGIYLLTLVLGRYYQYVPLIPFCILLSVMLVDSFCSAKKKILESRSSVSTVRSLLSNGRVTYFIIIAGLSFSLLLYSPAVRTYGEWEDSGNLFRSFLSKLSDVILKLPNDSVLHIYNFPNGISSYESKIPHAKDITYLRGYGVKSWIDLNFPANNIKVVVHSKTKLAVYPENMELEVKNEKENNVAIIIKYKNST